MTTLANLRVNLEANTDKFTKAMGTVGAKVRKLGLAAAGVGAGFAAIVKGGLDSADELHKMNLRTGVSVEALSALRHAASQSDVDFKKVENALFTMTRATGEATKGTKAQLEAFEGLGIELETFKQLAPEQQFAAVADALEGMEDKSLAAAYGQVLLGKGVKDLAPLMKGGTAALQEAADEAQRFGLIIGKDQAEAAARANDQMQKLQNTLGALGQAMAVEFAPLLADALEDVVQALPAVIGSIKAAFRGVGTAIGGIAYAAGQFVSGDFSGAATTVGRIGSDVDAVVAEEMDAVADNTKESVVQLRRIADNTGKGAVAG